MESVERVLDAPQRRDAVALECKEVALADALKPPAGRRMAAPLAPVGGRAAKAPHDGVALGHEVHGPHVDVWKRASECAEPVAHRAGHVACKQLVDELVPAAVDDLVDEAPDDRLPVHRNPPQPASRARPSGRRSGAEQQPSPRQVSTPSRTATAAISSAAAGSSHHQPNSAFPARPTKTAPER